MNELRDSISDAFTEIDGDRNLCSDVCQCFGQYEECCKVDNLSS